MTPLAHGAAMVRGAHDALLDWARQALAGAGLGEVRVVPALRPPTDVPFQLAIVPYGMAPWPKIVETTNAPSLIGAGSQDDSLSVVPDLWRRFGRALSAAVDQVFPQMEGPGRGRPHPLPPLDQLPPAVGAWYRIQGDTPGPASWVVAPDARPCGRLPALTWRPALTVRVSYVALAVSAGEAPEAVRAGLAALGTLSLGMNLNRVIRVQMPPVPAAPELFSFAEALGVAVGGDLGAELHQLCASAQAESGNLIGLVPLAIPPGVEIYALMRSLGQPLQPALHVALHLPLGSGPEFGPGSSPSVGTRNPGPDSLRS